MKSLLSSALTVLVALAAFACGSSDDGPVPTATESETAGPTVVECAVPDAGQRSKECLQICVDVSPSAGTAVSQAQATLWATEGLPEYAKLYGLAGAAHTAAGAGTGDYPALVTPRITAGCPDGFLPPPTGSEASVKTTPVITPSPFHLHLFITGDEELSDRLPVGEHTVRYVYERECSGHTCAAVTIAMYMSASDLQKPAFVGWAIADGTSITSILRYPCGHPDPSPKCQGIRP